MANQNERDLTIVLKGDGSGLTGTVKTATSQMKDLEKQLDATGTAAEQAGAKLDKASKTAAAASSAAAAAQTKGAAAAVAQATAQNSAAAATSLMGTSLSVVNSALLNVIPGMNRLASAAGSVFTALGGWTTVALAAAAAIYYLWHVQSDADVVTKNLTASTNRLASAHGNAKLQALQDAEAQLQVAQTAIELKQKQLEAARAGQAMGGASQSVLSLGVASLQAARQLDQMKDSANGAAAAVNQARVDLGLFQVQQQLNAIDTERANSFDALRKSLQSQNATMEQQIATFGQGRAAQLAYAESVEVAKIASQGDTNVTRARIGTLEDLYAPLIANAAKLDKLTASSKAKTAADRDAMAAERARQKTVNDIAGAYAKLANIDDKLNGKTDAVTKAWTDSAAVMRSIAGIGATLLENGVSEAKVQQSLAGVLDDATAARNRDLAAAQRQMDVSGRLIDQIEQEAHASTLTARDQAAVRAGMQYEQEARQANLHLTKEQMDAEKARVEAAAAAAFDMKKMADQQREVAQEYAGYWQNAASSISKEFGDTFTGQIHNLKDFASQGKSILQQWVSDIIAQFLRLRVLGPILSGAMGTVGGWLGIAGDLSGSSLSINNGYYGGGGIIGTTAGSVGDTGGAGGYAGYIQQGLQGYKLYNWATGLFGGSAAASPAYAGSASIINAAGNIGGNYGAMAGGMYAPGYAPIGGTAFNVGAPAYTPWGGSFSIGGYSAPYASAAGGLLGAYYGMHQGGGGISTGISTVGYGALGAGIAGTAAGVAGGASAGSAAYGAFGAAAAGTSWIPIVGWIMAGLAALDHFSGGKVFGSGWKPAQSNVALNVGPDGSSASANELLWKYKGQTGLSLGGFLTGGLSQLSWWGDKKTKLKQLDVTPEMLQAAQQLYDSMEKVLVSGAQKLGITVPDMITASLTAQTTYNKKGKVQGTEYLVQYLGQTWKEATAEAASQRLGADALLSVVAASAGDVAFKIAKQWQDSADTLADGVQTLLEAQQNIVRGNSLVALGSSATLKEVIAFTQGLQADGEKLADTYNRLMQASQAYEQFVGQFAPTSTSFGASLEAIAKQMQANIDQANQLAQAAGMQHAAESDLANIHKQAAEQAATAIAQLNSAAQDLAAKLYSVTNNTLSAVSAQLDKLAGKTQGALQLALGDNSPYNDKQKLDLALQGLRSGLTSADDVLSLGRKLYASSADYTGLYNKVQDILGLPGASGQQSLQDALKQYNGLYGQQQALQGQADATARFGDAKTLAQYVAEISTTHGIDYNEAASGLGFNLSDLAKDLGVTNIAGYLDQLKLQDIPGTTMDASASIVDAIQKLGRDLIQTITGAPLTSATGVTGSTSAATAEQTALLKSIDQRLAAIEESSDTTANTNKTMVNQGASQKLNDLTRTSRGMLA